MARRFAIVLGVAAAGVMALGVLLPATASADDSIYWSREQGSDSIRFGPLTGGSTTTPAQTLFDTGRSVRDRGQPRGRQDLLGQLGHG